MDEQGSTGGIPLIECTSQSPGSAPAPIEVMAQLL